MMISINGWVQSLLDWTNNSINQIQKDDKQSLSSLKIGMKVVVRIEVNNKSINEYNILMSTIRKNNKNNTATNDSNVAKNSNSEYENNFREGYTEIHDEITSDKNTTNHVKQSNNKDNDFSKRNNNTENNDGNDNDDDYNIDSRNKTRKFVYAIGVLVHSKWYDPQVRDICI